MAVTTALCAACGAAGDGSLLCGVCRQPHVGTYVGPSARYRVDALVARQGASCIWRATDQLELRPCVLQTYRTGDLTERQVLASGGSRVLLLQHPRVPVASEVFEEQDGALFVLVFAATGAPTMRELVQARGPLPAHLVLAVGAQICEVLEFLAAHDLVHEGVSPDTVAVTTDPQPASSLLTLTIPRMSRDRLNGVEPGAYEAPELAVGWPYSSAIAVYGLAGALMFGLFGTDPSVDSRATADTLPMRGIPPALPELLRQCRHPAPAERPSLADLRGALEAALAEDRRRSEEARIVTNPRSPATVEPPSLPTPPDRRITHTVDRSPPTQHGERIAQVHRPEVTESARENMVQIAQQLEQRGDIYGALDLYRKAAEALPPGSDAAQQLMAHAADLEARRMAGRGGSPGIATWGQHLPAVPRRRSGLRGFGWLVAVLACLGIGVAIAAGGPIIWPDNGRVGATAAPSTPTSTPPALVAPPANPGAPAAVPPRQDAAGLLTAADEARQAGEFTRALEILQRAKAMTPPPDGVDERIVQTHVAHGQRLLEQGDHDGSLAQYVQALTVRPNDKAALDGQKLVHQVRNRDRMETLWQRDPEAAIAAVEANFALDPDWRDTRPKFYALLIGRAERQWARGERDAARQTLDRARQIDPAGAEVDARLSQWFATPTPIPIIVPPPIPTRVGLTPQRDTAGVSAGVGPFATQTA